MSSPDTEAAAIRQVARKWRSTGVPPSSIREIASLAADFADMQRQLARREAEEQVARADAESARQTAEDALQLRDVFLRTLAHDLKTPLTSLAWHVSCSSGAFRKATSSPQRWRKACRPYSLGAAEAMAAIDELRDLTQVARARRWRSTGSRWTWSRWPDASLTSTPSRAPPGCIRER